MGQIFYSPKTNKILVDYGLGKVEIIDAKAYNYAIGISQEE